MSTDEGIELAFPFSSADRSIMPPEFARLREQAPVARVVLPTGDKAWLVTRYAEVRSVLTDSRFSRAAAEAPGAPRMGNTSPGPGTILSTDLPEHARLRKLVAQAFTVRRVASLRPRIEQLAEQLMHAVLVAPRPVDLLACFAVPLPLKLIFQMLGVPYEDCDRLHAFTEVIFSLKDHSPDEVAQARGDVQAYIIQMIEARRRVPTDDLLGALVTARDDHDQLSEQELVNFGLILLTVGHQSTANAIGSAMFTLLRHRDQFLELREHPGNIAVAVDELLRYNPFTITGAQMRVALQDVELAGTTIRAGEGAIVALGAANRDPAIFAAPDQLDLARAANPHLAFGSGIHHCLGAQLARLELQVALEVILRRLPASLRLAVPEQWLTWKLGLTARSLASLPVVW